MGFVAMSELVSPAFTGGYAVPSFCAWNAEVMEVVLQTAERLHAPVILMQGPGEFPVMSPFSMATVAASLLRRYEVRACLHLDHGDSMQMVVECADAGYTSVMLDFSGRPFDENAEALRKVVAIAHPRGITVEGEIGKVGQADDITSEGTEGSALTNPRDAVEYVRRTGVDILAVSIGNRHGFYHGDPKLDFDLLSELHAKLSIPLVMHGGTGIPEKDIQKSIGMGIAKVNVASELVHGFRKSLTGQWSDGRNLWSPMALGEATQGLAPIVDKWVRMMGADGKS
jgi:tagatose 1,6-diphosphate aldolase GatY/KbaY